MKLSIEAEPFQSADGQRLITALDTELPLLYAPEQRFGPNLKPQHVEDGRGILLVARESSQAVGCGAIRLIDPRTVEVKRMYVHPEYRGQGVGRAVLDYLEAAARDFGATRAVLETGVHQQAAIALYRHAGFTQVNCWGEYLSAPTSVCFAKELA